MGEKQVGKGLSWSQKEKLKKESETPQPVGSGKIGKGNNMTGKVERGKDQGVSSKARITPPLHRRNTEKSDDNNEEFARRKKQEKGVAAPKNLREPKGKDGGGAGRVKKKIRTSRDAPPQRRRRLTGGEGGGGNDRREVPFKKGKARRTAKFDRKRKASW